MMGAKKSEGPHTHTHTMVRSIYNLILMTTTIPFGNQVNAAAARGGATTYETWIRPHRQGLRP